MTANGSSVPRLVEVSGAEALWLLEGSSVGRLVFTMRGLPAIRPAGHVLEHGTLVVRAAVPLAALATPGGRPAVLAYHADEVDPSSGRGWSVTALGPGEPVTDPHVEAHYRRALPGWAHGPHDTLLRIRPQTTTGYRLGRPLAAVPDTKRRGTPR
ncbi:MAG: pyridoxamine 5'-phosphate oxidase family protein [Streptomycetaceae bacterium]|nr:pyridoxamine 5'-phosphate oxidase family protein [Streptomycetaceae bacterium]